MEVGLSCGSRCQVIHDYLLQLADVAQSCGEALAGLAHSRKVTSWGSLLLLFEGDGSNYGFSIASFPLRVLVM